MQPFFRLKKQNFRCFSMVLMCWCKKKVCKKIIFMHFQLKSISENHYTQHYQINTKLYNIGMTLVKGHWGKLGRGMKVSILNHSIFKCVLKHNHFNSNEVSKIFTALNLQIPCCLLFFTGGASLYVHLQIRNGIYELMWIPFGSRCLNSIFYKISPVSFNLYWKMIFE